MELNNIKDYYLLYTLLNATEQTPISSMSLSEALSLSNKSVQSNIAALGDYCKSQGFEIISKSGTGFYCRILDSKKTAMFRHQLTVYFSKNHLTYDPDSLEMGSFILYMVDRSEPISIGAICDTFFISKSKVYGYLTRARTILAGSKMDLVNERNRGFLVHGSEYIRRCYVANCLGTPVYHYNIASLFRYDFHYIGKNPGLILRIREVLSANHIVLDDEKFNALLVFLSYSEYRHQRHCLLTDFSRQRMEQIQQCHEYICARQLSALLSSPLDEESELASLTAFLLSNDDHLEDISASHYGSGFYGEIQDFFSFLDGYLRTLSPGFANIPEYTPSLWQLATHLYFQFTFGTAGCSLFNLEYNLNITSNAMIRYLARLMVEKMEEYFQENLHFRPAVCVCSFAQNLLYCADEERNDIRILLILKDGISFCNYITRWMNNHLKPMPSQIDFMSLGEASDANLDCYDLILSNYDSLDKVQDKYTVYTLTEPIDLDTSFVNEYYRICNFRNISLERIIHYFPNTFVKKDCSIVSTHDFLERVDNDLDGFGNIPFRTLRKRGRPINYYSGNNILVVPFLYREGETHENLLAIYFNDKKKHLKYDVMVLFSAKSTFQPDALFRLVNLCNEFCIHPDVFENLANYLSAK
jgi:biotin operon repressor